jgi:6-phosphogluconolactonase/glucosamine-6-phosphate isomerase/deaminase
MSKAVRFYKFSHWQTVADILAQSIASRLNSRQSVLWLVSGGSAIEVAIEAAKQLGGVDLSRLSVSLVDERFGPPGHKDSNWTQLMRQGFELEGAKLSPILNGSDLSQTTEDFDRFIKAAANSARYKISLLGLGADGHTAGILPNSLALDSKQPVVSYTGPDYQRITLSPVGLGLMDEAVVFAQGESKAKALHDLAQNLPIELQPAQIIKTIPRAAVYNDLVGEKL